MSDGCPKKVWIEGELQPHLFWIFLKFFLTLQSPYAMYHIAVIKLVTTGMLPCTTICSRSGETHKSNK